MDRDVGVSQSVASVPTEHGPWPVGTRLFSRLPLHVRPGDLVSIGGQPARVDTAKLAEDLRDRKCTVVIEGPRLLVGASGERTPSEGAESRSDVRSRGQSE